MKIPFIKLMPFDVIIGREKKERERLGKKGSVFLGKQYVKMGQVTSLSNEIYLDVVNSHVVLIVGKRGSGKCLTGDAIIPLSDGSLSTIKELAEKNQEIVSLNKDLKMQTSPKSEFFKRTVDTILKLKLRSGREIKLTPEHPLLTIDGWKEARTLTIRSRIATPRIQPVFGNESMPENEIKIIAYLLTEGHTKKPMFFSNNDKAIVNDLKNALYLLHPELELVPLQKGCYKINSRKIKRRVLGYAANRNEKGQFGKGASIEHEKTPIRKLVEKEGMYGKLAVEKKISENILKLPKQQLSLFLNRAFSCDGSIYCSNNYWEVSYSTSSIVLAKQMHHLLLRFGILSRLRTKTIKRESKRFTSYEIVVDGSNVTKFIQEIGFFGEKEKKQFLALINLENKKHKPNIDTIPVEIWRRYAPKNWKEVGITMGYSNPGSIKATINYAPTRKKLLQIAMADRNIVLQKIAESDIFWDEIVSKEIIKGETEVYDISVPEYHNFVANDIIVHNSYTMGVMAEGVADMPEEIKTNISVVLLDTMGIYWTMRYKNDKDRGLLKDWGLEGKGLDVKIYTPTGWFKEYKEKGIPTDYPFSIRPNELDSIDWCLTFEVDQFSEMGVLIQKIITSLKESEKNYSLDDIVKEVLKDKTAQPHIRAAISNLFVSAKAWGLFDTKGTEIKDIVKGGQVTVLDVSAYATMPGGWGIKSLAIGLIAQKLFIERMIARKFEEYEEIHESVHYFGEEKKKKQEFPMVWLIIDEAHEFLPVVGKTAASGSLITILREGRQPGISLVLATQQPGKIHTDVLTQADTVIAHRITAKLDVDALGTLMQSYMREGLVTQLDNLPSDKGSAIVFDDTNERMYPMKMRPRLTWHGGGSPTALKEEKKGF